MQLILASGGENNPERTACAAQAAEGVQRSLEERTSASRQDMTGRAAQNPLIQKKRQNGAHSYI